MRIELDQRDLKFDGMFISVWPLVNVIPKCMVVLDKALQFMRHGDDVEGSLEALQGDVPYLFSYVMTCTKNNDKGFGGVS